MPRLIVTTFFLFLSVFCFSQDDGSEHKLIQFSGVVVSGDSLSPVPFTSVMIKNTSHGTIADYYGFFSLVARAGDTVQFSSVGYSGARFIIPDTLEEQRY